MRCISINVDDSQRGTLTTTSHENWQVKLVQLLRHYPVQTFYDEDKKTKVPVTKRREDMSNTSNTNKANTDDRYSAYCPTMDVEAHLS